MDKDRIRQWLCLLLTRGVKTGRCASLVRRLGGIESLFSASREALEQVPELSQEGVKAIVNRAEMERADRQIAKAQRLGLRILTLDDSSYPYLLLQTHAPPPVLFVRGNPAALSRPAIAMVGARRATLYGRQVAESFSARLAELGITVISGMARGIDTCAHRGVLSRKGCTVAVLGSGLDWIYPGENKPLAAKIAIDGAVISEFPLGTPPKRLNFPARNRIIAGLGMGVIVVEAEQKSGALITARFALEEGREVFAVPGNITTPQAAGCNELIRDGAVPLTDARTLAQYLPGHHGETDAANGQQRSAPEALPVLDSQKALVYSHLRKHEATQIDQMARSLGLNFVSLSGILLDLQLQDLVRELPGKRFIRV